MTMYSGSLNELNIGVHLFWDIASKKTAFPQIWDSTGKTSIRPSWDSASRKQMYLYLGTTNKTISVAFSPQKNYTD
jgi:hypothetical protein